MQLPSVVAQAEPVGEGRREEVSLEEDGGEDYSAKEG